MKIVVFARALPFHSTGGMEIIGWDLITGLARRGHRVEVITTGVKTGNVIRIPSTLKDLLSLTPLVGTPPGRYSSRWWKKSREIYLDLQKVFHPDLVLSVSFGAQSVLPVLGKVPSVMQAHGTFYREFRSKLRSGRFRSILGAIPNLWNAAREIRTLSRFGYVVAVGRGVADEIRQRFEKAGSGTERVLYIPNGIDTDLFRRDPQSREQIRSQLGIPTGTKLLVWASRLHPQKGAHLALEAFHALNDRDWRFLMIGDGSELRRLVAQAARLNLNERVIFKGGIPHELLPAWLGAGDVFVFTSLHEEGLPLNILEAMSMDLPIVMSRHLCQTFNGAKGVYPVDPKNPAEVAKGIRQALNDRSGSRLMIEKEFSLNVMLDRYCTLFERIINDAETLSTVRV